MTCTLKKSDMPLIPRSPSSSSDDLEGVLGKEGACRLWGILGDHWVQGMDLHQRSQLAVDAPSKQTIVEIGPRYFQGLWQVDLAL